MQHGRYIGHDKTIRFKTALLQPSTRVKGAVLAQFDDLSLPHKYTHGWRSYYKSSFEIEEEEA